MNAPSLLRTTLLAALMATPAHALGGDPAPIRNDIPAEITALENPVELEESELRYWERQFKGKCARCHGRDGTGSGELASVQVVAPRDLTDPEYMATRSDGELFYQILKGGTGLSSMPAFGPDSDVAWSEDKVWHMVAFVRRFSAEPKSED